MKAIEQDLSRCPYEPSLYLDYAQLLNKIGFTDIGAAAAHRALILIEGLLNRDRVLYPKVRDTLIRRLQHTNRESFIPNMINNEAQTLHLQAYRTCLDGLIGCACFWEGLTVAKKALELWPRDTDLMESRQLLKEGFTDRHNGLKDLGADTENLVVLSRNGKVYQKSYPWIPADLYKRKPALVREVNKSFGGGNCEVRPVVFGKPSTSPQIGRSTKEHQDVGPLGMFATRDIKAAELVLVDQCITAVSNIPSSRLEHCDACHASLKEPFFSPSEIVKLSCCDEVAYCSRTCSVTAAHGYHSVLCGKNIDWLYDETGPEVSCGAGYKWRKIMFLRIMAIIIADRRVQIDKGEKPVHPLQHHVVARMAANYGSSDKLYPNMPMDWQYNENIVAPTKILMILGINIFTDPHFSQEVIQTIYWRMENNANMSIVDLSSPQTQNSTPGPKAPDSTNKNGIFMICLNPQYLFFNHSCEPNISWHGAIPNPYVGLEWITGYNGEIMKPGSSTVFCRAFRDIKAGEELNISYVGDPKGVGVEEDEIYGVNREGKRGWLKKWFEGGCGCEMCIKENLEKEDREARDSTTTTDGRECMDSDAFGNLEGQV